MDKLSEILKDPGAALILMFTHTKNQTTSIRLSGHVTGECVLPVRLEWRSRRQINSAVSLDSLPSRHPNGHFIFVKQ